MRLQNDGVRRYPLGEPREIARVADSESGSELYQLTRRYGLLDRIEFRSQAMNRRRRKFARYPIDRWNIYGAQASDGDNYGADSSRCVSLLGGEVLPLCQYFAYVEVGDGMGGSLTGLSRDSDLWRAYSEVAPAHPHFAMRRVGDPAQIFTVFHELFAKGGVRA